MPTVRLHRFVVASEHEKAKRAWLRALNRRLRGLPPEPGPDTSNGPWRDPTTDTSGDGDTR